MTEWDVVLGAEPGQAVWTDICRLAEGSSEAVVADVADRLRAWPDRLRPMPDRWWAQRQAAEHRPWHALATHRRLCRLGDDFYVTVAACPDDLRLLLAGSGATSNSELGEVLLFRPALDTETGDPDDEIDLDDKIDDEFNELLVACLAEQSEAVDGLFSPDGSRVTVGYAHIEFGRPGRSDRLQR